MATRTSLRGGNWSNPATWDTPPADGESVVIAAGHTVIFDADLSGWTIGVSDLTITSDPTTPGRLTVPTTAGTYYLPIANGKSIKGTNDTVKGQLYAGTSEIPLPAAAKFTIECKGTASIDCTYLDVKLYASKPLIEKVQTTVQVTSGNAVFTVDQDVTSDSFWTTTAGRNAVAVCNVNKGGSSQRTTITNITSTQITVGTTANQTYVVGTYLIPLQRNIDIFFNGSQAVVKNLTSGALNCSIRQINSSSQGSAVDSMYGVALGGIYSGHNYCVSGVRQSNISGICCSGSSAVLYGYMINYTGFMAAVGSGFYDCPSVVFSGIAHGVNSLAQYSTITVASTAKVWGSTQSCYLANLTICQGAEIGGSTAPYANSRDINAWGGRQIGYGAGLRSPVQCYNYTDWGYANQASACFMYDIADSDGNPQLGQIKGWTAGGNTYSETPPAGFPGSGAYAHRMTFETASWPHFMDFPMTAFANEWLVVKVHIKQNTTGMTMTPRLQLVNNNYTFDHTNSKLVDKQITDNTSWQTHILTYKPTTDQQLILRVIGKNASGYLHFAYEKYIEPTGLIGR